MEEVLPRVRFTFKRFVLLAGKNGRAFSKLNGSTPQRNDLLMLVRHGPLAQKQISLALGVTRPVVSRMIDALEMLGLVKRTIPPEDRRYRIISLTPKGEKSLMILFDNYACEEGIRSLQSDMEGTLMYEWGLFFKRAGVLTEHLSLEDQSELLEHMQPTVWKCAYYGDPKCDNPHNPNRWDISRDRPREPALAHAG
jgi:DNA-binding MarR family transcriptional regulator